MTAGWAALNTLRERCPHMPGEPCDCPDKGAAFALVQTALEADADLRHNTRRMLQALDAYWMWCDGWQGPRDRYPRSESTAEDWWHRFEKYRAKVESALRAVREGK